jgi:DNA-directed RNA polymerase subunit RPC12/RpoP
MAKGDQYGCASCGHVWRTRKSVGSPSRCPSCNSRSIQIVRRNTFLTTVTAVLVVVWFFYASFHGLFALLGDSFPVMSFLFWTIVLWTPLAFAIKREDPNFSWKKLLDAFIEIKRTEEKDDGEENP